jgi:hypothetical protein
VVTPLANVRLSETFVPIDDRTVLVKPLEDPDWAPGFSAGGDQPDRIEVMRLLGDYLLPNARFMKGTFLPAALDTRIGAALVTVEQGTESVALHRARTVAVTRLPRGRCSSRRPRCGPCGRRSAITCRSPGSTSRSRASRTNTAHGDARRCPDRRSHFCPSTGYARTLRD